MPNGRIVIDTREKLPYSFYDQDVIRKKLDTGDYSIEGFEDTFAVERKSLSDYLGSITHDRDRFEREIQRGTEMAHFEVVIEADKETVKRGEYYPDVPPMSAINTAKAWSRPDRYDIPFHWAGDRKSAKALTMDLIRDWEQDDPSYQESD